MAGWIKRGPVGIIDATLRDSMETFRMIKHHLDQDLLPARTTTYEETVNLLKAEEEQGSANLDLVTLEGWQKINDFETKKGEKLGKIREKILNKEEMMDIACDSNKE